MGYLFLDGLAWMLLSKVSEFYIWVFEYFEGGGQSEHISYIIIPIIKSNIVMFISIV